MQARTSVNSGVAQWSDVPDDGSSSDDDAEVSTDESMREMAIPIAAHQPVRGSLNGIRGGGSATASRNNAPAASAYPEFPSVSAGQFSTSLHLDHAAYEAELEAAAQAHEEEEEGGLLDDSRDDEARHLQHQLQDQRQLHQYEEQQRQLQQQLQQQQIEEQLLQHQLEAQRQHELHGSSQLQQHFQPPVTSRRSRPPSPAIQPATAHAVNPPSHSRPASPAAVAAVDLAAAPLRKLAFRSQHLSAQEALHLCSESFNNPVHIPASLRAHRVHAVAVELDLGENAIEGDVATFLEPLVDQRVPLVLFAAAHNRISGLDGLAAFFGSLTSVDVSHNDLSSLEVFAACTSLTSLNVASNRIRSVVALRGHSRLDHLDLRHNLLSDSNDAIDVFASLQALEQLALEGNAAFARKGGGGGGRAAILAALPQIRVLDDEFVQATNRRAIPSPLQKAKRAVSPSSAAGRACRSPSPSPAPSETIPPAIVPIARQSPRLTPAAAGRRVPTPGPATADQRVPSPSPIAATDRRAPSPSPVATERRVPSPSPAAERRAPSPSPAGVPATARLSPQNRGTSSTPASQLLASQRGATKKEAALVARPAIERIPSRTASPSQSPSVPATRPTPPLKIDPVQVSLTRELLSLNEQLLATEDELTRSENKRLELSRMHREQERMQEQALSTTHTPARAHSPALASTMPASAFSAAVPGSSHALADMKSALMDRAHRRRLSGSGSFSQGQGGFVLSAHDFLNPGEEASLANLAPSAPLSFVAPAFTTPADGQFSSLVNALDSIVAKSAHSRPGSRNDLPRLTPPPVHPSPPPPQAGSDLATKSSLRLLSESDDFNPPGASPPASSPVLAPVQSTPAPVIMHARKGSRSLEEAKAVSLGDMFVASISALGAGTHTAPPGPSPQAAMMRPTSSRGRAAQKPDESHSPAHARTPQPHAPQTMSFDQDEPDDFDDHDDSVHSRGSSADANGSTASISRFSPAGKSSPSASAAAAAVSSSLTVSDLRVEVLQLKKKGGALLTKYQAARNSLVQHEAMLLDQRRVMDVAAGLAVVQRLLEVRSRQSQARAFLEWIAAITRIRAHGVAALRCVLQRQSSGQASAVQRILGHWRTSVQFARFADLKSKWLSEWEEDLAARGREKLCALACAVYASSVARARRSELLRALSTWRTHARVTTLLGEAQAQLRIAAEEKQLLIALVLQHKASLDAAEKSTAESSVSAQLTQAHLQARADRAEKELASQAGLVRSMDAQLEAASQAATVKLDKTLRRARACTTLAQILDRAARRRLQAALSRWELFGHENGHRANDDASESEDYLPARTFSNQSDQARQSTSAVVEGAEDEAPEEEEQEEDLDEEDEQEQDYSPPRVVVPTNRATTKPMTLDDLSSGGSVPVSNGNGASTSTSSRPQDALLQYHLQAVAPPQQAHAHHRSQTHSSLQRVQSQPPYTQSRHGLASAPPNASQPGQSPRRHDIHNLTSTGGSSANASLSSSPAASPRYAPSSTAPRVTHGYARAVTEHSFQASPFHRVVAASPSGYGYGGPPLPYGDDGGDHRSSLDAELRAAQEARRALEAETADIAKKISEARARANGAYAQQQKTYAAPPPSHPAQARALLHSQHATRTSQPAPQTSPRSAAVPPSFGQPPRPSQQQPQPRFH